MKPTHRFRHYQDITGSWCNNENIKFIVSDLDGTLAAHNEAPTPAFRDWLAELEQHGVGVILASNNHKIRVQHIANTYKIVGFHRCRKPFVNVLQKNLLYRGLNPDTSLFLGDQLFTDVWCGRRLGMRTALVNPIPGIEPFQTKCKRPIEKIVTKFYMRKEEKR